MAKCVVSYVHTHSGNNIRKEDDPKQTIPSKEELTTFSDSPCSSTLLTAPTITSWIPLHLTPFPNCSVPLAHRASFQTFHWSEVMSVKSRVSITPPSSSFLELELQKGAA